MSDSNKSKSHVLIVLFLATIFQMNLFSYARTQDPVEGLEYDPISKLKFFSLMPAPDPEGLEVSIGWLVEGEKVNYEKLGTDAAYAVEQLSDPTSVVKYVLYDTLTKKVLRIFGAKYVCTNNKVYHLRNCAFSFTYDSDTGIASFVVDSKLRTTDMFIFRLTLPSNEQYNPDTDTLAFTENLVPLLLNDMTAYDDAFNLFPEYEQNRSGIERRFSILESNYKRTERTSARSLGVLSLDIKVESTLPGGGEYNATSRMQYQVQFLTPDSQALNFEQKLALRLLKIKGL